MKLNGLNVLITGATGFIGQALVERFVREGAFVRAMSRSAEKKKDLFLPSVEAVSGNILNPGDMKKTLKNIDVIIHCAATMKDWCTRDELFSSIFNGTKNLLEAVKEIDIKRFIYISSTVVYGLDASGLLTEDTPIYCRKFPYGEAKIEAEKLVYRFHRNFGVPVVILRPAHVYGPGSTIWTDRLSIKIKKKWFSIPNNYGFANPCYIQNLVEAVYLASTKDEAVGRIFNVADEEKVTWRDFLMPYMEALGRRDLLTLPYPLFYYAGLIMEFFAFFTKRQPLITRRAAKYMMFRGEVSIDKLKGILGYKPPFTFKEAMSLTAKYVQKKYG